MVEAVVSLAEKYGLETVAEDQRTLQVLLECGVDYAQGYAIGRPGPLDNVLTR